MANYAYRDKERRYIILANEALEEDRNKSFYCPNPRCNSKLFICAVDGCRKTYFRATKSAYKHIANCPYANSAVIFDDNEYNRATFSFENAIQNLLVENNSKPVMSDSKSTSCGEYINHTLRTIRQIYSMCKQFPPNYSYGNEKIGKMILDDRTAYWYPKGVFGFKIIESCVNGRFYDNDKNEIYLVAPIANPNYHFILSIPDINLYRKIRNMVFENKDKFIIVAGQWNSSKADGRTIKSIIHSNKQITII
ncbi:hypothetical protein [Veillonella sp.]|uniref:hypothetical protein n=1 Tax=Veillonella sp. TaxID=1926307 RepID=UPI0028FEF5F9|nr:hypothetical protein [Veillonella sp.]MDU1127733.1 hypothetical protein [Veillonella sp.]